MKKAVGWGGLVVGVIAGVIVAPLLLLSSSGSCAAAGGSGSIAGRAVPGAVAGWAAQASSTTGVDVKVLVAQTYVESAWGSAQHGLPDSTVHAWSGGLDADADRGLLAPGGATAVGLGRPQGIQLSDWINSATAGGGEHAVGFAQFIPSTWRAYTGKHPKPDGGHWDPWNPLDAMTLEGYYMGEIMARHGGDVPAAFREYGTGDAGVKAWQELVKTWKAAAGAACGAVAGALGDLPWLVKLPVPQAGWQQVIPVPAWPGGFQPSAVTPQCVAGALWTWAFIHHWRSVPGLGVSYAKDMYAAAVAAGWKVSSSPVAGAMVVYGPLSAADFAGHVGTVTAAESDRFELVEQNYVNTVGDLGPHWGTWDVRVNPWPDSRVIGFIVAPAGV